MKLFSGITVLLLSISTAFAAPSDLIVTARDYVTMNAFNDDMITKITDARASILVASGGPVIRRDCFRSYRLNLPHAPQTIPYQIELNLPVKITKTTVAVEGVVQKANELAQKLRNRIFTGCRTDITVTTMIEGESTGGAFRSEIQFFITKEGVKVQSGTLSEKITPGVAKNVNLVPSIFPDAIWTETWEYFDPTNNLPRRNY